MTDGAAADATEQPDAAAPTGTAPAGRWRALALVGAGELLAMSLWFSASAVAPELTATWGLTGTEAGFLTSAVQLGFVAGALASAGLTRSRGRKRTLGPKWKGNCTVEPRTIHESNYGSPSITRSVSR